jgi:hypothetical protein
MATIVVVRTGSSDRALPSGYVVTFDRVLLPDGLAWERQLRARRPGRPGIWTGILGNILYDDVKAMAAKRKRGITDAVVNVIKRYPEVWGEFRNRPDSLEARFYQVRTRLEKARDSGHD